MWYRVHRRQIIYFNNNAAHDEVFCARCGSPTVEDACRTFCLIFGLYDTYLLQELVMLPHLAATSGSPKFFEITPPEVDQQFVRNAARYYRKQPTRRHVYRARYENKPHESQATWAIPVLLADTRHSTRDHLRLDRLVSVTPLSSVFTVALGPTAYFSIFVLGLYFSKDGSTAPAIQQTSHGCLLGVEIGRDHTYMGAPTS